MKMFLFAGVVAAVLLSGGCAHTSTLDWTPGAAGQLSSSGKQVLWNLRASNNGMFLFNWIPLWSGMVNWPNRYDYELFDDQVNEWDMRRLLDSRLRELKADHVEDVKMSCKSSGALGLWIIWKRRMEATGVAVGK